MNNTTRLSIFIAEDHELTAAGLRLALETAGGFRVVGEASDGRTVVDMVQRIQPDVVLMDIKLVGMDGIDATRELKRLVPHVRILMLTSFDGDGKIFAAFAAGADGYCTKNAPTQRLVQAVRSVGEGNNFIDSALADQVLWAAGPAGSDPATPTPTTLNTFSSHEASVLQLLCEGLSNAEIAESLTLDVDVVKTHLSSLLEKLDAGDRTRAAVEAVRRGWA